MLTDNNKLSEYLICNRSSTASSNTIIYTDHHSAEAIQSSVARYIPDMRYSNIYGKITSLQIIKFQYH